MKRTAQIAKCIKITRLNETSIMFTFDREILLNSSYIDISKNLNYWITVVINNDKIIYTTSVKYLEELKIRIEKEFLNQFCLLRSCYLSHQVSIITEPINREVLWQDFGNLKNTNLEEIDFYIRILNE